jgi:hypothetical protein
VLHQNYSVNTVTSVRAFFVLSELRPFSLGCGPNRRATTHRAAKGREARTEGTEPRRIFSPQNVSESSSFCLLIKNGKSWSFTWPVSSAATACIGHKSLKICDRCRLGRAPLSPWNGTRRGNQWTVPGLDHWRRSVIGEN